MTSAPPSPRSSKARSLDGPKTTRSLPATSATSPTSSILNVPGGTGVKLDGIAMRKNDSSSALAVNLALQDIMASGEYDKIYDRWFGPTSTAPVPRQGSIEVWPNG